MSKKILVIDDYPEIVTLMKSRFEAKSFEVITALDGEEGHEKFKSEKPDLIVLDIKMPKVNGIDFVEMLKKDGWTPKKVPIIVLTAASDLEAVFSAKGINDYVLKPFVPRELIQLIEKRLGI